MPKHIMVDIETTGTDPVHTAMIQLAAVEFDPVEKTLNSESVFDRCLYMPENRRWDESTREWWGKQKASILDGIWNRMEDPEAVMKDFINWVGGADRVYMWAKPTTFEAPFLASYARQFGLSLPWHYRDTVDVYSYLRGRGHEDPYNFCLSVPMQGEAHDALSDTLHQVKMVLVS